METRYRIQSPIAVGVTSVEVTSKEVPSTEVTYGQAEAALKSLPVYLLPEAYEYLRSLAEDAKVLALVEAGWNEPSRPIEELFAAMDA